jgi:hypothetical protein
VRLLIPVTFAVVPSLRRFGGKKSDLKVVFSLLCAEIEKIPENRRKSLKIRFTGEAQTQILGLRLPSLTADTGEKYVDSLPGSINHYQKTRRGAKRRGGFFDNRLGTRGPKKKSGLQKSRFLLCSDDFVVRADFFDRHTPACESFRSVGWLDCNVQWRLAGALLRVVYSRWFGLVACAQASEKQFKFRRITSENGTIAKRYYCHRY